MRAAGLCDAVALDVPPCSAAPALLGGDGDETKPDEPHHGGFIVAVERKPIAGRPLGVAGENGERGAWDSGDGEHYTASARASIRFGFGNMRSVTVLRASSIMFR
jgi:hypothetical protein